MEAFGCEPDAKKGTARKCPVCSSSHFRFKCGDTKSIVAFCRQGCSWEAIKAKLWIDVAPDMPADDGKPLPNVWFTASIFEATMPGFSDAPYACADAINACLFKLCRILKSEFNLRKDYKILARFLYRWRELAKRRVGDMEELETVLLWDQLWAMWSKVRLNVLQGPLAEAYLAAEAAPFPACAYRYENETIRKPVRLCQHLQYQAGEGAPWFLTTRMAALLFGSRQATMTKLFQRSVLCETT